MTKPHELLELGLADLIADPVRYIARLGVINRPGGIEIRVRHVDRREPGGRGAGHRVHRRPKLLAVLCHGLDRALRDDLVTPPALVLRLVDEEVAYDGSI
jgi:hypothetical protein